MREIDSLRERLDGLVARVPGDRVWDVQVFALAGDAVDALARAEAERDALAQRVAELERVLRMAFDVCVVLRRELTPFEIDTMHALIHHVPGLRVTRVPGTRFGWQSEEVDGGE